MRPIIFRGLSATSGEWVYGDLIQRTIDFIFPVDVYTIKIYESLVEIRSETRGQFSGIRDRNNIAVFEGDVIFDSHREEYGKVIFTEATFAVEWNTHVEDLEDAINDYFTEVVGNIHENPELIKGEV